MRERREFGGIRQDQKRKEIKGKNEESQERKGEEKWDIGEANRERERVSERERERERDGREKKRRFSWRSDGRSSTVREEKSIHASLAMRGYQNLGVSSNSMR